jgi:hypothetical protein
LLEIVGGGVNLEVGGVEEGETVELEMEERRATAATSSSARRRCNARTVDGRFTRDTDFRGATILSLHDLLVPDYRSSRDICRPFKKNKIFSDGNLDFFLFEIKRPGILSQMLADAGLIHFMATNECRGTNS